MQVLMLPIKTSGGGETKETAPRATRLEVKDGRPASQDLVLLGESIRSAAAEPERSYRS
jgi:hypothetical protein